MASRDAPLLAICAPDLVAHRPGLRCQFEPADRGSLPVDGTGDGVLLKAAVDFRCD